MARKNEAENHLRSGKYPYQIAAVMGISINSVLQYLQVRVGEGAIRLSDLYFSWPEDKREILVRAKRQSRCDLQLLVANALTKEEYTLFHSLRSAHVFYGDMYADVSEAELRIHKFVRAGLKSKYGVDESNWWRRGVSESIRVVCAQRREMDEEPVSQSFAYTTLINLSEIIEKNWSHFREMLPADYTRERKGLERDLRRLNHIRNAVMHPVKEKKWREEDFVFVRGFLQRIAQIADLSGD